jgi:hypothetical protein
MKALLLVLITSISLVVLAGCCTTDVVEYDAQIWSPVYKNLDEIRNGVKTSPSRDLKNPGKIYFYGNYILINEVKTGIHIIDNFDPKAPKNISFIEIPGNGDMAVRNNILYADSYLDLVAIDISNPANSQVVKRINDIFPQMMEAMAWGRPSNTNDGGLIVDFVMKDTVIKYYYNSCHDNPIMVDDIGIGNFDGSRETKGGAGNKTGIGGSMARFTIYDNYLYAVDYSDMQVFDITQANNPKAWSKVNIGWEIETIFPFKNKLFVGSTTGMYIYDVSKPWNPTYVSEFRHIRACDPVVANDDYAYVTLRSGTRCVGTSNQLDIIDIRDIFNPKLVKTYPMQEPAGLGLDGTTLFVCDGPSGLKVFDVADATDIKLLDWQSDLKTYDVIPLGKSLLMIGSDGLFQYDYTDPTNLKLLSKIPIVK